MTDNKAETKKNSLWTKDFSIITAGSVISMFGNAMSGFAMSLLVLDYTQSTLLYSIYVVLFTLPQIIMPVFSGTFVDRFSRRKTIYTLDFISSVLYACAAILLGRGWFSFPVLAVFVFTAGSIGSIYSVAYESFYPMLITEGNYQKAYSIAAVLETLSVIMVPVAAYFYNLSGIAPLLAVNAACFFMAAVMETRISAKEEYVEERKKQRDTDNAGRQMLLDIKEGVRYLLEEKGLGYIALYFTFSALFWGCTSVLMLPYFRSTFENGEYIYMIVYGMSMFSRGITGMVYYKVQLPSKNRYMITLAVYIVTSITEGFLLYLPVPLMAACMFMTGILGVTSYTIRVAATQSYVPHEKKGRFNGAFNMLNTVGMLSGEIIAGAMAEFIDVRLVVLIFGIVNMSAAVIFIGMHRSSVEPIYLQSQE